MVNSDDMATKREQLLALHAEATKIQSRRYDLADAIYGAINQDVWGVFPGAEIRKRNEVIAISAEYTIGEVLHYNQLPFVTLKVQFTKANGKLMWVCKAFGRTRGGDLPSGGLRAKNVDLVPALQALSKMLVAHAVIGA